MMITMPMLWMTFAVWSIAEVVWNLIRHRDVSKAFDKVRTWGLYSAALSALAYLHPPGI